MLYQKDGPGSLLRMYKDRITAPEELAKEQERFASKEDMPGVFCPHCNALLGVPMVYEPEKRLAYRVIPGTIRKLKSNGTWPPEDGKSR
ncbi:MAG: hypothetical protein LBO78_02315 [Rickettsiales bacterium]|jgi:hypothetical protein|nr:hypothetical protein [Rickettsiales bacterium]